MRFLGTVLFILCLTCMLSVEASAQSFPYHFTAPSNTLQLDDELIEISGLSLSTDEKYLVAVQDENGLIYFLDKQTGAIVKKSEFWKDGDYEGVEAVGNDIFVIKNTGTVYCVKNTAKDQPDTEKFNYDLNKYNDVEGLAYDPNYDQLLLACKAHPDGQKDVRGIFSFNLTKQRLIQEPAYVLTLDAIRNYLETNPDIPRIEKVRSFFYKDAELSFSPSAIAIHPQSGELYLLSSKGKMIVVMKRNNEISFIQKLQKEEHPQPEGLCFDRRGNLYISNEGKNGNAVIHIYQQFGK